VIYFRLVVTPAPIASENLQQEEAIAHVFTDPVDIELASEHTVKKLHSCHWRLVRVECARRFERGEKPWRQDLLTVMRSAENSGFAFHIESSPIISSQRSSAEHGNQVLSA
jgi:hypothetical protein